MTKQEFLAFSLPYGLKVYVRYNHKPDHSELEKMIGIIDDRIITDMLDEDIAPLFISEYGLCLRPLSDLTKEIEHNGEKFVPIVELAELANPYRKWKLSSSGLYAISENGDMDFEYDDGYNCFLLDNSAQLDQFKLFRKLIDWHFDLADLISKGEAIDVNILEINPYK